MLGFGLFGTFIVVFILRSIDVVWHTVFFLLGLIGLLAVIIWAFSQLGCN